MGSCFFLRFFFKPHDFVSTWFRSSSWSPSGAIWGLGLGGCCWDFFVCLHSRSKMMVKFYIYLVLMRTWCITYCSTLRIICIWRFSLKSKAYLYEKKWGEWFVESAISVWASYGIIWTWIKLEEDFLVTVQHFHHVCRRVPHEILDLSQKFHLQNFDILILIRGYGSKLLTHPKDGLARIKLMFLQFWQVHGTSISGKYLGWIASRSCLWYAHQCFSICTAVYQSIFARG